MHNIDEEFEKYNQRVKNEEIKYANSEVKIENYKFPHIYLTEEEIEDFNKKCDELGFDIKVVPICEYLNLNPEKNENEDGEEDEVSEYTKMERVEKFMDHLGRNLLSENKIDKKKLTMENNADYIMNEVNSYIGKKQRRIFFDHNQNEKNKNNETKDKINDNNDFSTLSETNKGKKGFKKKYNYNNDENLKENANKYFKRIIDTAQELKNNEIRKDPLVDEILEKSQLLEPDDLKSLASKKRISVVGDNELSEFDLKKKDVRQLDGILADININSDVSKLKNEKRENIKRIKARKNLENQSILDYMYHKAIKEQKKLESSQNFLKEKSNSVNNNLEKEFDSCSDDESI